MKQAWNSKLTEVQTKAALTLYGKARTQESVFGRMQKLILMSKSAGTIAVYVSSIRRWQNYATRMNFKVGFYKVMKISIILMLEYFRSFLLLRSTFAFTYRHLWTKKLQ